MAKVFKDNEELNKIVNDFYIRSYKEKIGDIDEYLKDIENNISIDFENIYSMCNRRNTKASLEIFKIYTQGFLYEYVGLNNKTFFKIIDNGSKLKNLQDEQSDYYTNFVSTFNEIKMILIHSMKQYYKIVKELGNNDDLRELYAIYQTVGLYIINTLPEYYKKDLDINEVFEDLNRVDFTIEHASNRYIINIDYILRDYIQEKFGVDLFEYHYAEQRKKMLRNEGLK